MALHPRSPAPEGDEAGHDFASTFRSGIELYDGGRFWDAHEAWETLWRAAPVESAVRYSLQGLIQCAASALKTSLDRPGPAASLLAKARANFEKARHLGATDLEGVDIVALAASLAEPDATAPLRIGEHSV